MAAWEKFPESFSLLPDRAHPDSNKVMACLMHANGPLKRGYLARVRPKVYALTSAGRHRVLWLRGEVFHRDAPPEPAAVLTAVQEAFLRRVADSVAVRKTDSGRGKEVTYGDAWELWDLGAAKTPANLDMRLADFSLRLQDMERLLESADWTDGTGRVWTAGDVRVLSHMHAGLLERFGRHIQLQRSRLKGE